MSATPRPPCAEASVAHLLNFALTNATDVGKLCGLTLAEIEAAVEYARHAVNTFDEAKAALEHIDRLAGCQSNNYTDLSLAMGECRTIARAVLAHMEGTP